MKSILIVEDDEMLNEGIQMTLKDFNLTIHQAYTLKEANQVMDQQLPDLILLDVNLPDGSGFSFCKEVRSQHSIPIIFLTANDMEMDIVRGLEMGGDDYITKPFSLMVLRARVNSVLRRYEKSPVAEAIQIGSLSLDFEKMVFMSNKDEVSLSKTEQKLLKVLVANQGRVLSKEHLLDKVWGTEYVDDHALTVTVNRLRAKLQTNLIKSIYGIGYTFVKEEQNE